MPNKVSPIFSLADPVEMTVKSINEFDYLGESHDGHHVAVLFRPLVKSLIKIDHSSPIILNRHCTMFNFVNNRGTLYGHLFVVDPERMRIEENRLMVSCGARDKSDYEMQTFSSEKTRLLFYKSSGGNLLVLIAGAETSEYITQDS